MAWEAQGPWPESSYDTVWHLNKVELNIRNAEIHARVLCFINAITSDWDLNLHKYELEDEEQEVAQDLCDTLKAYTLFILFFWLTYFLLDL